MKICYVDESGDTGVLHSATSPIQPVFSIVGVIVDHANLQSMTTDFLDLKGRFFPGRGYLHEYLNRILREIKGSELRKKAADTSRRERRHAFGFLDGVVFLLEKYQVRLIGRVWIKGISQPFNGRAVYTSSIQSIYTSFECCLRETDDLGVVIADSRTARTNSQVSHSIFTQKFKVGGDDYGRIIDLPTFAHSQNHSGLQLADLVCSGIVTPMAINAYCQGHVRSVHVRPGYGQIKSRYAGRIKALQYRHLDAGRWRGGLTVSDSISQQSGGLMFRP